MTSAPLLRAPQPSGSPGPSGSHVTVWTTLRSAHLERARADDPTVLVYQDRRDDFDEDLAAGLALQRCRTRHLPALLWRLAPDTVEINEPLMRNGVRRAAVTVAAVRLHGLLRQRRTRVVSYAIENLDPYRGDRWPSLDRALSRFVLRSLDRFVLGTEGARRTYRAALGLTRRRTEVRMVTALPAPCPCPAAVRADRPTALFLGAFDDRKGVLDVMRAWDLAPSDREGPGTSPRLVVVGAGRHSDRVEAWAAGRPDVEVDVDPPRARVHQHLRDASVVVLLSRRTETWREQVGLPIVEGLAHGCHVVTTAETGLADWLAAHGHDVLASSAPPEVREALDRALARAPRTEAVLSSLPQHDGRLAAARFLRATEGMA
ncbi:glycosyltransferase [Promicromonospora iranensis]|uniref:Glycosyltransferase involved in cell wall biosynthesis n=1 Tax=Promicromonospora iranensis TaxID=1105144 RepID=A0ABU2CMA8_9MICO|nr:glycosyltransferase [Promicromonospora iranensis]MDR7382453.1 glycosyltransferase involved in cell wall biosynthesis [Promicromonospora iranensis]